MRQSSSIVALTLALSSGSLAAPTHAATGPRVAPAGFVLMEVAAVVPHDDGNTLLLIDSKAEHVLPIGIGNSEALSIHLRLQGEKFDRPLTHDLLDQLVARLGGKVAKVHIERLKDGVFHGRVFVTSPGGDIAVDARASDACALALGSQAPIYVSRSVVTEAGFLAEALLQGAPSPKKRAPTAPSTVPASDGTLAL
jgi:bifunctional DNase/RNase